MGNANAGADLDGSGRVNMSDNSVFSEKWQQPVPANRALKKSEPI